MEAVEGDLDSHDGNGSSIWWSPPSTGFIKLNVDGSFCLQSRAMFTGGVLRDVNGGWLGGFSSQEGVGSVLMAELLAVRKGLDFAWNRGVKKLLCELDSLEALHLLRATFPTTETGFVELAADIIKLLKLDWE
ncbi:Ribonuclease H-like superfamily, partial [Sesbania bispinosa]